MVSVENRLYDGHLVHRLDLLLRFNDVADQISGYPGLKHGWRDGRFDGERQAVLDVVNSIMPGILAVALVFGLVALIKKGVRPVTLVLGILVLSVALAFFGIF